MPLCRCVVSSYVISSYVVRSALCRAAMLSVYRKKLCPKKTSHMLCGVRDVVVVLSQKNEPWPARANSKHCDCLHTKSRIVVSVKSAITAIKVISYVYSNHFGAIFSPTKVAKVFLSAKKYVHPQIMRKRSLEVRLPVERFSNGCFPGLYLVHITRPWREFVARPGRVRGRFRRDCRRGRRWWRGRCRRGCAAADGGWSRRRLAGVG